MSIISSGTVTVAAGATSSNLEVIQEGALIILDGGQANEITLSDGGTAEVSSGGILYVCAVSSGGTATIQEEGYAESITVVQAGLCVMNGGIVDHSTIMSGGTQILKQGDALTKNSIVMSGGLLQVNKDCSVKQTTVYGVLEATEAMTDGITVLDGGVFKIGKGNTVAPIISSGGLLVLEAEGGGQNVSLYAGGCVVVSSDGYTYSVKNNGGRMVVENGGVGLMTTVNSGGRLVVSSGGSAANVTWTPCEGIVEIADGAVVTFTKKYSGVYYGSDNHLVSNTQTMVSKSIGANETMCVMSGGTVDCASVGAGGGLFLYDGGKIKGIMSFDHEAEVSAAKNAVLDFDLAQTSAGAAALVNDLSVMRGTPVYTLTVSNSLDKGVYVLADGAAEFSSTISVINSGGASLGSLTVGETIEVGDADFTLNLTDSLLTLTVVLPPSVPTNLIGTQDKVSWDPTGAAGYIVEYSTDDFESVLQTATTGTAVDMYELPSGTFQWRVKEDVGEEWAVGNEIKSEIGPDNPKVVRSNADGNEDLFFASTTGSWDKTYYAQHVGSVNDWAGTNDIVSANGKGRIQNLFFGSDDPNVLCLTDGDNGDAIFVDDVYTELPEELETNTARLYRIQEIRAGAGDDIVDMTSQRLVYNGNGLTIRGGNGNDTIWANKGENKLFGDAGNDRIVGASGNDVIVGGIGNDRMHGGGGDDIFTFCDNWGTDTVEHLADGTVTLWFASGDESKWDASSLTYTDGENSVTVKGVTTEQITLKFGDDGSDEFVVLSGLGAFLDATSELVFEESGNGLLASL